MQRLRSAEGTLVVPGTGDGLGARLIEQAGFEAVYVSGYAVEGTCGKADVGLLSYGEIVQRMEQIADVTDLPVISDADTGYGNASNVIRTVRGFERAGVAALQLEDQELPKKCGSMAGKRIVSTETMVGKIKAAVDARSDENLLIIGRSDAMVSEGLEAALERLARYREAGADLLMLHGRYDRATAETIVPRVPGPFAYLNAESLTMPMIPVPDLRALGVAMAIFPTALVLAAAHAMRAALGVIAAAGSTEALIGSSLVPPAEFNRIVGLERIQEEERRFMEPPSAGETGADQARAKSA